MEGQTRTTMRRILLFLSCIILSIGNCGGPLLIRLYFLRGGNRIWFSSWLQTAGFPVIFIPLLVSYHRRRRACSDESSKSRKFFLITPFLSIAAALLGVLVGVDNYFYSYGMAKLPVSTSSLIVATQLVFTAGFAFLLVKQKFTAFSTNAVVLLTVGAVVLGLRAGSDRPAGESNKAYLLGFVMTVAAAALYGLILPLIELSYLKAKLQAVSFSLVLEFQMIMGFVGTIFSTVGMVINKDFEVIPREAREFELGVTKYYVLAVFTAIVWQFFFVGALGVISYGSSLLSALIVAVLLPVTEILAVIFYHEKFEAEKGISLFLSIWGFVSYFYGDIKNTKKDNNESSAETEMTSAPTVASTQAV
ncbi:PREDICTED: purine permease 3-like [Ipomoea nil]|uniref:purine permease 3-like n=1 Tax=Ipomoea nil TaxID=35883 RepID=UPI0009012744|nr:PREDICTED: purine permease 3-like [Ipomoea nil]